MDYLIEFLHVRTINLRIPNLIYLMLLKLWNDGTKDSLESNILVELKPNFDLRSTRLMSF
jgi:hypothetical protein